MSTTQNYGAAGLPDAAAAYIQQLAASQPEVKRPATRSLPTLSDEQQRMVDVVATGRDVIVDATVGSGKTTAIQALCSEQPADRNVLYLTYSKLLKIDAQQRVRGAKVQNYHGIVYPSLRGARINCGISESIRKFNENFRDLSADFPRYDLLVVDEYQDINEEYAQLLRNIKSLNPLIQTVMVGDLAQKVRSDTVLDVQGFVTDFCDSPEHVGFTQSFRVGPELGDLLGEAWNKPVTGVNKNQVVHELSFDEALELILTKEPGDLLCLGSRNGPMATALNEIEKRDPERFNKNSVYASIRDADSGGVSYGDDTAVFTTFDASKGLERKVSVVFDYDEDMWDMRNRFPNADPVVLRNVFLVAASRGKDEVVFVRKDGASRPRTASIGYIPTRRFTKLPEVKPPVYEQPFQASGCFDFKYAENVEACFDLLAMTRVDDGTAEPIEVERSDGLIDLSPVVGNYAEAVFFDGYDQHGVVLGSNKVLADSLKEKLNDDAWNNALVVTALETDQLRYVDQVRQKIPAETEKALIKRLGEHLPRNAEVQTGFVLEGRAIQSRDLSSPIVFEGIADVIHNERVFELKFVSELSHEMFLQLGLYLVMTGYEVGVLWNVHTDERWEVRVPDRDRFMNAVVLCVSKQAYRVFKEENR